MGGGIFCTKSFLTTKKRLTRKKFELTLSEELIFNKLAEIPDHRFINLTWLLAKKGVPYKWSHDSVGKIWKEIFGNFLTLKGQKRTLFRVGLDLAESNSMNP